MSLIQSAKLNGHDPYAYLKDVFLRLPTAACLERAGVPTLVALMERTNAIGARWWVHVPGVGERKAARTRDRLNANEKIPGFRLVFMQSSPGKAVSGRPGRSRGRCHGDFDLTKSLSCRPNLMAVQGATVRRTRSVA